MDVWPVRLGPAGCLMPSLVPLHSPYSSAAAPTGSIRLNTSAARDSLPRSVPFSTSPQGRPASTRVLPGTHPLAASPSAPAHRVSRPQPPRGALGTRSPLPAVHHSSSLRPSPQGQPASSPTQGSRGCSLTLAPPFLHTQPTDPTILSPRQGSLWRSVPSAPAHRDNRPHPPTRVPRDSLSSCTVPPASAPVHGEGQPASARTGLPGGC